MSDKKTCTQISFDLGRKMAEQQVVRDICKQFDVLSVVRDFIISNERKAELFLLGASFSTEEIRGARFNIMILDKSLYILSMADEEQAFFKSLATLVKDNARLSCPE